MAHGKYVALTILDMGANFVYPGEKVELDDDVAKVLLKKRAIKPVEVRQEKKIKEVKDYGTNN